MTISNVKKQQIFDWLDTPPDQRVPPSKKEFRESIHISYKTFNRMQYAWEVEKLDKKRRAQSVIQAQNAINAELEEKATRPNDVEEVLQALHIMATQKHNAFAAKVYLQAKGELVEKAEHKVEVGLSADEITKRNFEAERRLQRGGYRVATVQNESPLLPE